MAERRGLNYSVHVEVVSEGPPYAGADSAVQQVYEAVQFDAADLFEAEALFAALVERAAIEGYDAEEQEGGEEDG